VQAHCPEVLAIQLPRETERIPKFLDHLWIFDHSKITTEDLEIDVSPATTDSLERVSDLTYRTSQFNISTIRRSEAELRKLQQEGKEILIVRVRDRFGDYGLVGVIIYEVLSRAVMVDTFLLRCRAMGWGVEHQMLARLGMIAKGRGAEYVDLRFIPTSKNKPAADFLKSLWNADKETCERGWRYRVSAGNAAVCRLDPDTVTSQNGELSEAVLAHAPAQQGSISPFGPQSKDDILVNIAIKLNDPNTIHEVISSVRQVRPELTVPFRAPSSPVEKEIVSIWSEFLGIKEIGIDDSFFDLGGHSLLAMQMLSRLQTLFKVELSPRLLVTQECTVAALSKVVLTEQIQQCDASELGEILERLDAFSLHELQDLIGKSGTK
jgi:acyl carrier protein